MWPPSRPCSGCSTRAGRTSWCSTARHSPPAAWGSARQAKDEIHDCPPVLLIIGRPDDGWLATWSGADAVISHPIDPRALASALAGLMRQRGAVAQA